jgi:hypothetical protein
VRWFQRRFELVTVGEGVRRLDGGLAGKSLLALSMDDGYRDNARVMAPLLERQGACATVYLESRPLDERQRQLVAQVLLDLARSTPFEFWHRRYGELTTGTPRPSTRSTSAWRRTVANARYQLKRVLKYDADVAERDRVIDAVFAELGGDERALCEELYMDWDEARALAPLGVPGPRSARRGDDAYSPGNTRRRRNDAGASHGAAKGPHRF